MNFYIIEKTLTHVFTYSLTVLSLISYMKLYPGVILRILGRNQSQSWQSICWAMQVHSFWAKGLPSRRRPFCVVYWYLLELKMIFNISMAFLPLQMSEDKKVEVEQNLNNDA